MERNSPPDKRRCPLTSFYEHFPYTKNTSKSFVIECVERYASSRDIEIVMVYSPRMGDMPHYCTVTGGNPTRQTTTRASTRILALQLAMADWIDNILPTERGWSDEISTN